MDFENTKSDGGASFLVSQIKSFIGAGVANRVIALFDNDTAGTSEILKLKEATKLPSNIKIMQYPKLSVASSYPTIGPTGISNLDVNGLACSLELYLGDDALKKPQGYVPVQWTGYNSKLKQYQGEIIGKERIKKNFYKKLSRCENNHSQINDFDWSGLKLIFKEIFSAFCD
jgi:hypothetical protein